MNEHLEANSSRARDSRNTSGDQHYAAHGQREQRAPQAGEQRTATCGLDTGARGWRYVYQTH